MGKILLYGFQPEKLEKVRKLSESLHFTPKIMEKEDYSLTIASLFDIEGYPKGTRRAVEDLPKIEFVMLGEITKADLDQFVEGIKREQLQGPVIAVLTEHNVEWVFGDLIQEVYQEHLMITQQLARKAEENGKQ